MPEICLQCNKYAGNMQLYVKDIQTVSVKYAKVNAQNMPELELCLNMHIICSYML